MSTFPDSHRPDVTDTTDLAAQYPHQNAGDHDSADTARATLPPEAAQSDEPTDTADVSVDHHGNPVIYRTDVNVVGLVTGLIFTALIGVVILALLRPFDIDLNVSSAMGTLIAGGVLVALGAVWLALGNVKRGRATQE